MNMRKKEKRRVYQTILTICMVFSLLMASSSISYAATPTMDSEFSPLVVGTNDLKVENYDGSQTMAGCFTAPEEANYSFSVVNIGELTQNSYLLNNNFAQIDYTTYKATTNSCSFGTYHLKMGEKIYFYATSFYKQVGTLASRLIISNESKQKTDVQANSNAATSTTTTNTQKTNNTSVSKSKVTLSPKSCRLKKGKKVRLKLKNNKKRVSWISKDKKIASVTSKGIVKAKRKGTTYICAIVSHKLYRCKVTVR